MEGILLNFMPLVAMILLMVTFFFSQKAQYIIHAVFLFFMGLISLLGYINLKEVTALQYVITIVVVMSGREMIRYGMKSKEKHIKHPAIWTGVMIIILTVIPALSTFGAISFNLPPYPTIIDSLLYIIGSIVLGIGTYMASK